MFNPSSANEHHDADSIPAGECSESLKKSKPVSELSSASYFAVELKDPHQAEPRAFASAPNHPGWAVTPPSIAQSPLSLNPSFGTANRYSQSETLPLLPMPTTPLNQDPIYKPAQIAARLDVKVGTVWAWCREGRLQHLRLSPRSIRIRESDLRNFFNSSAR